MHYFHNHNAIFICLALYIPIITFISFNILVYFPGITKLITFLFDRQDERGGKPLNLFRIWLLFLNYRYKW